MDLDEIREFQELNDCLKYSFLPVQAEQDGLGCLLIRFSCGREIFCQDSQDIKAVLENMYLFNNQYFILDEYLSVAKYP